MISELKDLCEHLERFRAVTLQVLDIVADDELSWRPDDDSFSCGQQLMHIAQAEDFYAHGLSIYLRQMGHVAPFYAIPLPLGDRPDFKARQDLGGF